MTFCRERFAIFLSFKLQLNDIQGNERILVAITNFVTLFCQSLSELKYTQEQKEEFLKNRELFTKKKMEEEMKEELEKKEREKFAEQWKLRNKKNGKKLKNKNE